MKVIDTHVHIGTWNNPGFFGRTLNCKDLFEKYDKFGITGAVLMPTDHGENESILEELKNHPTSKYKFLAWAKPDDDKCFEFIKNNLIKISGLKFHPSLDRKKFSDDMNVSYIELAEQKKLPVSVHCGRWQEMAGYSIPISVAKERRNLKIILSHMGGDTPELAFKAMEEVKKNKLDNVYFDTAGFREYWVIEQGIKDIGADRFLFASDFPLGHPKGQMETLKHIDASDADKEKILFSNARDLFKWGDI